MSFDLFISYARRDDQGGQVRALKDQIEAAFRAVAGRELRVFFDTHDIKGMDDWRYRILDCIRGTRLLLICLSPNYLQSESCFWEFNEFIKHEAALAVLREGVAPVDFVEVKAWPGGDSEPGVAEWVDELRRRHRFDLRPWSDLGVDALKDAVVKEEMEELNSQIRDRLERISRMLDARGNVDRHNERFVGRTDTLRKLRERVGLGKVGVLTVVHGLGGMGKTAVAIEYAHAFAHEYPGGRWQVRCEGRDDLRAALVSQAGVRDLEFEFIPEEKADLDLAFERVLRELKRRAEDAAEPHRVLLILDNVDRPKLLEPAQVSRLPKADWLHVIATTRLGEHDLFGKQKDRAFLPVDELPEGDALALIEGYQPSGKFREATERAAASEIVRLLDRFTLAVETAAVYLGQFADEITCDGFRDRLKKEGLTGLEGAAGETSEGVRHGEKGLLATLSPTLERLGEPERLALAYAALLPADNVPLPWLRALLAERFPELGRDAEPGYPDPWRGLTRRLFSFRLLQPTGVADAGGQTLVARMHRLVQEVVRHREAARVDDLEPALMARIRERAEFLWEGWVAHDHRWELGPLAACAWQWLERGDTGGAYLANQAAGPLEKLGKFAEAEPLYRRALAIDERSYGPDHPAVAIRLNNLAWLLHATDRPAEAEPFFRRALAIGERSYGPDHPGVANNLNNLAALLQATNRPAEAEPLYRRALAIDERSYGPDHPGVANNLNNLAALLQATNRPAEAEPLYRRALAIGEKSLDPDHPIVASALNNLAELLRVTNRPTEAEPLSRQALAICERSLGPDHPNVASALNNLALLLQVTNRLTEAEPFFRRALEIHERSLGSDHPNVAVAINNLAALLQAMYRSAEAEPLSKRMLEIFLKFKRATGHEHPHHRDAIYNYASLLAVLGQSPSQIVERLNTICRPFGFSIRSS